jgi:hypothetical protein
MLTKKDIHFLQTEFKTGLKMELKVELLEEFKQVFVTKDEFITRFDAVMYELKAIREDIAAVLYRNTIHSDTLENHEERLVSLESTNLSSAK